MRSPGDDRRSRLRPLLAAGLAGAAITAALTVAGYEADARHDRERDVEVRAQAAEAMRVLTRGLEGHVGDVANLFNASSRVTREEFETFTAGMLGASDANSITWLVPDPLGGTPRLVVRYATQRPGVASLVGYDVLSDPVRRAAVSEALRRDEPAVTGPLDLHSTGRPGFVVFEPVGDPRARVSDVRGVVSASFSFDAADAALRDAVPAGAAVALALSGTDVVSTGSVDADAASVALPFAGRTLTLRAEAPVARGLRLGPAALLGGTLLTLLALLAVWARGTGRRLASGRLATHRAERRFLDGFASAPIGMAVATPSGRVVRVNDAFCRLLRCTADEAIGALAQAFVVESDVGPARDLFLRAIDRPGIAFADEIRMTTPEGVRWTESHVTFLADEAVMLIQAIDMTQRREFEHRLVHQAEHDALTELLNRRGFRRVLDAHLARHGGRGALLLLDLDHFKAVNDLHGHSAGDDVLRAVAEVLRASLRDGDTVARLGGDEFAVLLPDADAAQGQRTASRLVEALARDGASASVGVAMLGTATRTPEEALMAADLAMYDAKDAGRGRFALLDAHAAAPSATRDRLEWVDRIRGALAEDRMRLAAQPIRDLRDGRVVHHELLLRLQEPDGRLILPGAFLPVAERFGLVREIDRWVATTAIDLLDRHRERDLVFHVNLSGISLGDAQLLAAIRDGVRDRAIDPSRLVFEITETAAVTSFDHARAFARGLADLGCPLALDDFGAGFGSFVYLKQLPFDLLKIDGEFVRHCAVARPDRVIVESLVHAATGLGTRTVAEFVEDQATEDLLHELGVDLAQGYHVGAPVPVEQVLGAVTVR